MPPLPTSPPPCAGAYRADGAAVPSSWMLFLPVEIMSSWAMQAKVAREAEGIKCAGTWHRSPKVPSPGVCLACSPCHWFLHPACAAEDMQGLARVHKDQDPIKLSAEGHGSGHNPGLSIVVKDPDPLCPHGLHPALVAGTLVSARPFREAGTDPCGVGELPLGLQRPPSWHEVGYLVGPGGPLSLGVSGRRAQHGTCLEQASQVTAGGTRLRPREQMEPSGTNSLPQCLRAAPGWQGAWRSVQGSGWLCYATEKLAPPQGSCT